MPALVVDPPVDRPHAPIVFFEVAINSGMSNGTVHVTLCTTTFLVDGNEVTHATPTVVAYLRSTVSGALALRDALDKAVAIAQHGESQNLRRPI